MSKRVWHSTLGLALIASLAACGGGDDEPAADEPAEAAEESSDDATSDTTVAADEPAGDAVDGGGSEVLAASQSCLEATGMTIAPADEASTGMSDDMRANLGIVDMVVFDKGAGWGGTIEVYGSAAQADVAAEGYSGSPLGYEVGQVDLVVFKSTGPAEDITDITTCLEQNG